MTHASRLLHSIAPPLLILVLSCSSAVAADGQMSWAAHVTLAPRWLDPAETESAITPFLVLYAIHKSLTTGRAVPPGHDRRVRLAASLAIDRKAINASSD